ncbi:MAG: PAS domain S-box protein [Deltaproteobacteria bacterium]|nr:PAS domain S-box protein [Deltaproteobacteria bacterium]
MKVKFSLYQKFFFGFLLVATLPILLGTGIFYISLQEHLEAEVGRVSRLRVEAAGKELGWYLEEINRSLTFCAGQYLFSRDNGKLLARAYHQHPAIHKLVVVDSANRVVEALTRHGYLRPGEPSPLSAYQAAFPEGKKLFFSQWRLEPQLVSLYPILSPSSGRRQGYLFAELALKKLFLSFPRQKQGDNELFLVNLEGEVVAHADITHVLKGSRAEQFAPVAEVMGGASLAMSRYVNFGRKMVLGVAARIEGLPLIVVSEIPEAQAYALTHVLRGTFFGIFCLTLALIMLGSWYLSRSMTKPIEKLYRASEKIRGGFLEPLDDDFPADEIGAFALCFNQMVAALKKDRELRTAAENNLRESESRYRIIADYAYDMECWRDPEGKFIYVSPSCERVTGYGPERFYTNPHFMNKLILAEDLGVFLEHRHEVMGDGAIKPIEFRIRHRDGSVRWLNHVCRLVSEPGGKALGVRGSNRDVTARRLAEEFLAVEREYLAVTLRSIGDGVITSDNAGRITLLNPVAEKLTGWRQAEAAGLAVSAVFRVVDELSQLPRPCPVTQVLSDNRALDLSARNLLVARSGEKIAVADSAAPIIGQSGRRLGVVLIFRDIRNEKNLQQERFRREKLEAVGVLAGGIAHDFNNLLMALQGRLDLVRMSYNQGFAAVEKHLEEAGKAISLAESLALQLLTFAKGGMPVKTVVDLPRLVMESAELILHGSRVKAEYEVSPELWEVAIDGGQISQVIYNLITNARQALADQGVVRIKLSNAEFSVAPPAGLLPGRYIEVAVGDQGCGIAPEILPDIFAPYFTTKEGGSGLGLATCYSIIAKHGGLLKVESQVGVGTTFTFYLPSSGVPRKKVAAAGRSLSEKAGPPAIRGRVLVMDDDLAIREVVGGMLELLGYDAVTVPDGESLLEVYRNLAPGEKFSAVLMDLSIPGGMGGREAVKRLRKLEPKVKVIVSSGYCQDPVMADFKAYGFDGMLAKPYRVEALRDILSD